MNGSQQARRSRGRAAAVGAASRRRAAAGAARRRRGRSTGAGLGPPGTPGRGAAGRADADSAVAGRRGGRAVGGRRRCRTTRCRRPDCGRGVRTGREGVAQLAHDGRLDGRGRTADELAEFVELGDHVLAGLTEFFGDCADADLACHCSPWLGGRRRIRTTSCYWALLMGGTSQRAHVGSTCSRLSSAVRTGCATVFTSDVAGSGPEGVGPRRCRRTMLVSSVLEARRDLPNARLRSAASRHPISGCSQAPRPGSRRRGSGTTVPATATTRSNSCGRARRRHPMHVRIWALTSRGTGLRTDRGTTTDEPPLESTAFCRQCDASVRRRTEPAASDAASDPAAPRPIGCRCASR